MNIEIKESIVQYFIQTRVGGGAEIQRKHIYYVDKIAMKNLNGLCCILWRWKLKLKKTYLFCR